MNKMSVVSEVIRVLKLEGQSLFDCVQRLDQKENAGALEKAVTCLHETLAQGGKIIVTGVGKSGKIGQKIAATLCSTGSFAVFVHPTEGLHGDLGMVRPGDSVLALSYTGNTDELVQLLPSFKQNSVQIVGIGGNRRSRLAEMCDAWVDAWVENEACPHNLAPTSSTTLTLALGDAIALTLMQLRGFDAQAFARNHPGGSLGKRLNLCVSDLMHRGSSVPTLGPDATMEEVILESTRKMLGAVLIIQEEKLLGIITDGDLRRALVHREKFFQLKAQDVMTRKPVTARPEMLVQVALDLMENRPAQIAVLPVVGSEEKWQGILRLHDIVRVL